jgi:hypothetical protein
MRFFMAVVKKNYLPGYNACIALKIHQRSEGKWQRMLADCMMRGLLFDSEVRGNMFLRNVG